MGAFIELFLTTFALVLGAARADPDLLQDVCVANLSSGVKVNGFPCKNPSSIGANDFFFAGLAKPGFPNNTVGSLVSAVNVEKIPGLNTLGVSLSRIDYAPGGVNPPHTHPRATEIVFMLEGELEVGFITTSNVLISKWIKKGEIFVFPKGLVHFQKNVGRMPAAVITAFNSQFPGTQSIAATLFAASPTVPDDVLSKAFQIGRKEVQKIKSKLAPKKLTKLSFGVAVVFNIVNVQYLMGFSPVLSEFLFFRIKEGRKRVMIISKTTSFVFFVNNQ